MTIFRNLDDHQLYVIYHVRPPKYTGSWYEAHSLFGSEVKKIKRHEINTTYLPKYHA